MQGMHDPADHQEATDSKGDAVTYGYVSDKGALAKRLHRIEGQVRGIERMVADERYCIDILTQIAAVNTALESVAVKLLEDHVRRCVARALASGDEADAAAKTQELLDAVQRFSRTR
jgi:CsoR family transcriptional regulator, copper-sensing transcriptional repressor